MVERAKRLAYAGQVVPLRFWRTWAQHEIDLIEDRDGALHAYEFKWNPKAKASRPKEFASAYPEASFEVITPTNLGAFVGAG